MINEVVTTDSAGIGAQGGYNDGDTRIPFVLGTFKRFFDDWSGKKKKKNAGLSKKQREKTSKGR